MRGADSVMAAAVRKLGSLDLLTEQTHVKMDLEALHRLMSAEGQAYEQAAANQRAFALCGGHAVLVRLLRNEALSQSSNLELVLKVLARQSTSSSTLEICKHSFYEAGPFPAVVSCLRENSANTDAVKCHAASIIAKGCRSCDAEMIGRELGATELLVELLHSMHKVVAISVLYQYQNRKHHILMVPKTYSKHQE